MWCGVRRVTTLTPSIPTSKLPQRSEDCTAAAQNVPHCSTSNAKAVDEGDENEEEEVRMCRQSFTQISMGTARHAWQHCMNRQLRFVSDAPRVSLAVP